MPYRDGANENLLGVYYYNEASGNWDYVGGRVNKQAKKIQAEPVHFSTNAVCSLNRLPPPYRNQDSVWRFLAAAGE